MLKLAVNSRTRWRAPARADWLTAAGVFIAALAVRLMFLFSSADRAWPHSVWYEGDAPEWVNYAAALQSGQAYEFDLPLRSPAVAYLLHWLGATQGPYVAVKCLWCAFSSAACALAYLGFAATFTRSAALIAAVLCVFSFGSYVTATSLNNEALYTPILIALVWGTQRLIHRPAYWVAAALAILHGVAMLIRPEHPLLLLLMLAYGAWMCRRVVFQIVILLGAVLVCLPWSISASRAVHRYNTITPERLDFDTLRPAWTPEARAAIEALPAFARQGNALFIAYLAQQGGRSAVTVHDVADFFQRQFGYTPEPFSDWIFITMKGPVDFALANHPSANGGFSKAALALPGETDPTIRFARPDHNHLFNHGYAIGWGYIKGDFGGWLQRCGAKLATFNGGLTLGFSALNFPLGSKGVRRPVDLMTSSGNGAMWWNAAVLATVALGILCAATRRLGGIWLILIAYKLIVTVLFYGYARQAVSILPAFFIFMALAVDQLARWIVPSSRIRLRLGIAAAITVTGTWLCLDIVNAFNPRRMTVTGSTWNTPELGPGAFQSLDLLHLDADTTASASPAAPGSPAPANGRVAPNA